MQGKDYREVRDAAAGAGSLAHAMIETDIQGKEFDEATADPSLLEKARSGFNAYKLWAEQSQLTILNTEMHLVSDEYRFGGTPDAVGFVNDTLCVLDWKTSNALYADNLIQAVAYKYLWEEAHPDQPITGGIHICRFSKEEADFEHRHFASNLDKPWRAFILMRELYDLSAEMKKRVR